jgi:hypothetical protein
VRSEARNKKLGTENKFAKVFIARDKSEELDVTKQNAEDADTQHLQDHHQEQARRGVRRERQV